MKRLFCLLGLASLLTGCIADRDRPGLKIKYETLDAAQAQGVVTPEVTKECSDRLAKELPNFKIVGSFFLTARGAARAGDIQMWPSGPNDDIVALAAPSTSIGMFNATYKNYVGCSYRLRDRHLEFRKVHFFGTRSVGVGPERT